MNDCYTLKNILFYELTKGGIRSCTNKNLPSYYLIYIYTIIFICKPDILKMFTERMLALFSFLDTTTRDLSIFSIGSSPKNSMFGRLSSEETLLTFLDGFLIFGNTEGLSSASQWTRVGVFLRFSSRSLLDFFFFNIITTP